MPKDYFNSFNPADPQAADPPGFVPEVTSLIASPAGDGWDALLDASECVPTSSEIGMYTSLTILSVYGDKTASSAFAAATSAVGAGDNGAAASYFSEATAVLGDGWSQATDNMNDAWTSFTSACEIRGRPSNGDGRFPD